MSVYLEFESGMVASRSCAGITLYNEAFWIGKDEPKLTGWFILRAFWPVLFWGQQADRCFVGSAFVYFGNALYRVFGARKKSE